MALDASASGLFTFKPILSTNPTIPDNKFKPNKVMHEWTYSLAATGDASGGGVTSNLLFGTIFDKNHYIVITLITFTTGANSVCSLNTHTDRWDNLYTPGQANVTCTLWKADASYVPASDDMIKKPLYLGRPRHKDSNPGECYFYFATNTDTQNYNALVQGYTLERPLPFSSILQP